MTLRQATHILRNIDASNDDEIAAIHVAIDAIYRLEHIYAGFRRELALSNEQ